MSDMKRTTPAKFRAIDPQLWMRHGRGASELLTAVVSDDTQELHKGVEHRIDVERTHFTSTGARYRVTYLGGTLVESAHDPLFEACRILLARGITGTLVMYSRGSAVPRMCADIENGAKLAIIDNAKEGPRIGRYRPYPTSTGDEDPE